MNTYTRALILTAMTAISLTQGCSCSSDKDDPVVVEPPVPEETIALSGAASKGIVAGANVAACLIELGANFDACANPVATATTGADGRYTLQIPAAHQGKPMYVRVTGTPTSTMKCDLPGLVDNCGPGIGFGGTFIYPDIHLNSLIPIFGAGQTVNVTTLTGLAYSFAMPSFIGISSMPIGDISSAFGRFNSQVANRFGLSGDLTSIPVIDLTDSAAVKKALDDGLGDALTYNSLGAAIVKAVQADSATALSIQAAIEKFVAAFVAGGLSDNALSTEVTGLNEILTLVNSVISQAALNVEGDTAAKLSSLIGFIQARTDLANAQTPTDTGSQGTASNTSGADGIAKAKAFVAVLGDLTTSLNMAVVKQGVTVESRSDAFDMQLQAAELATSEGVDDVLEATAKTAEAFAAAYEAYYDNNQLTEYMMGDINVTITPKAATETEKASVTLEVEQDVMDVAIKMMAVEMLEHDDPVPVVVEGTTTETDTIEGMVSISGTAETATVKLTVMDDSAVSADELMSVYDETATTEEATVSVKDLMLKLHVMLQQKTSQTVTDPVMFEGELSATLESFMGEGEQTWVGGVETTTSKQSITSLNLNLWGSVGNTTGDKATVSFNVMGDGTGVELTQNWMDDIANPETDSNFADLTVNLAFMADIAGVSDAVMVQYGMSRPKLKTASATLKLAYPGVQMNFATTFVDNDATPQKLIVTNQDGVLATFVEGDKVMGTFYVAGAKVATSEDAVVTYSDGDVGSLDLID